MRRRVGTWSWRESVLAACGAVFLAGAAWLAVGASPLPEPSEQLALQGAGVFRRERCVFCHTLTGQPTSTAQDLTQSGPDLRQPGRRRMDDWQMAHLLQPDAVVAGSTMPSFGYLPPEDLRALVAYLQTFSPSEPLVRTPEAMPSLEFSLQNYREGRELYDAHCGGCHGKGGKGNGEVGHVLKPEPRDLTDAAWLAKQTNARLFEVVSDGVTQTAMPGYRDALSPVERVLIAHYVRYFGDPLARQFLEQGFFYPLSSP